MAGRKAVGGQESVTLFPFLSILCALIGVLIMLLMGMTIGQVVESAAFGDVSIAQVIEESLEVDRLLKLKIEDPDAEKKLLQVQREKSDIESVLKRKLQELPNVKLTGEADKILVEPTGSGTNRRASFIDCTENALIVQDENFTRISKMEIPSSKKLRQILDQLRIESQKLEQDLGLGAFGGVTADVPEGKGDDVIFIIRPDGVETFKLAAKVAEETNAKYAFLPVPGYGPLDLTRFGAGKK